MILSQHIALISIFLSEQCAYFCEQFTAIVDAIVVRTSKETNTKFLYKRHRKNMENWGKCVGVVFTCFEGVLGMWKVVG